MGKIGFKVNEAPAALIRNGKVIITYSASATDENYVMGLLWADEDSDLLNGYSWHKLKEPVFRVRNKIPSTDQDITPLQSMRKGNKRS